MYAGRLVPHKNVDDLIDVFSELQNEISQDLVIVGSGPLEKKIKEAVKKKGLEDRVTFYAFDAETFHHARNLLYKFRKTLPPGVEFQFREK